MTAAAICREMQRFVVYLLESDLVIAAATPGVRDLPGGKRLVAVPTRGPKSELMGEFGTIVEYQTLMRDGENLVMLKDGSLLQAQYVYDGAEIFSHRLAYYPCPVTIDSKIIDPVDFEILLVLGFERCLNSFVAEVDDPGSDHPTEDAPLLLRTPIRFDYFYRGSDGHSPCHMHMNSDDCRIPVYGPLSLGHFIRFVFRNFYAAIWDDHATLREWPLRFGTRTVESGSCTELYWDCRDQVATA